VQHLQELVLSLRECILHLQVRILKPQARILHLQARILRLQALNQHPTLLRARARFLHLSVPARMVTHTHAHLTTAHLPIRAGLGVGSRALAMQFACEPLQAIVRELLQALILLSQTLILLLQALILLPQTVYLLQSQAFKLLYLLFELRAQALLPGRARALARTRFLHLPAPACVVTHPLYAPVRSHHHPVTHPLTLTVLGVVALTLALCSASCTHKHAGHHTRFLHLHAPARSHHHMLTHPPASRSAAQACARPSPLHAAQVVHAHVRCVNSPLRERRSRSPQTAQMY
jgi:hypothetical protein